jgi:hypothetical protein
LGNILPWHALPTEERLGAEWVMCDPGPLAPLAREAGLGLVSQKEFIRLTRGLRRWYRPFGHPLLATRYAHIQPFTPKALADGVEAVRLMGFDQHQAFPVEVIRRAIASLQERLAPATSVSTRILLVDRGVPDPFYASRAVLRRSGRDRRSLPNAGEIEDALRCALRVPVTRVLLEGMSLSEQAAQFRAASLIVAQHGAALTNLVWSGPSTRVVEIVPCDFQHNAACFRQLSHALGLDYRQVAQAGPHATVDVQVVVKAAHELLSR